MRELKTNTQKQKAQVQALLNRYYNCTNYQLYDVYNNFSYLKEKAFKYCEELKNKYCGSIGKITSHCINNFTYCFIGAFEGKKALFYITKSNDFYAFIDNLN